MKKERNRFDALAEELADPVEPEKSQRKTLTKAGRARLDALIDKYKIDKNATAYADSLDELRSKLNEQLPPDFDDEELTPAPNEREYKFPPPPQTLAPSRQARAAARAQPRERTRPNAYIAAMGQMWPVEECSVSSRAGTFNDLYDKRIDQLVNRLEVMVKLRGVKMAEFDRVLREGDPALVIMQGDSEPQYIRLECIKTNWTMTSANIVSVEITAEGRQLS